MVLREAKLAFRAANIDESAGLFQAALDAAPASDMDTRIAALQGLASAERARGNLDAAEQRYTQALALLKILSRDHVNARSTGLAYQGLGMVQAERGDIDAGIRDLGQARVWIQRSGDEVLLGAIGHNIGKADVLRGDYAQALAEFERAIGIFERFRVGDYLANSLSEKASVLLALNRPGEATDAIRRAQLQLPGVEDDRVAVQVLLMSARIQIARGQLRDASASLDRIRTHGVGESDPPFLELLLRLALAQGDTAQAAALARGGVATKDAGDGLMLAAVQAAVRVGNVPLARAWLASDVSAAEQDVRYHRIALALAQALIARAEGDGVAALAAAQRAASQVGLSPDAEIQAGVLQARTLLDARQSDAASAVMGRLEKSADTDYRVAWAMAALYRALGDQRALATAMGHVDGLRGDRPPAVEPVL
jgi:tetratricopeptide (TPR) repeat protein